MALPFSNRKPELISAVLRLVVCVTSLVHRLDILSALKQKTGSPVVEIYNSLCDFVVFELMFEKDHPLM